MVKSEILDILEKTKNSAKAVEIIQELEYPLPLKYRGVDNLFPK